MIKQPAQRLGVRFEPPEMAARIVDAAAREPGSMPMLSDLLADAWRDMAEDRQSDGVLRFPFDIVDISRPLADKAERFLAGHREEDILRRLFTLKLALVPKEGDIVRRRARRGRSFLKVWEVATGAALFDLSFSTHYYKNVLLHGSMDDLVAETGAGLVRIPWKTDHLIAESCRRFVRDIEDDEWRRFFDQAPAARICSRDGGGTRAQTRSDGYCLARRLSTCA